MKTNALLAYLQWLCEELVQALLRPVWRAYCRTNAETSFHRFNALVNAANCWPCCVEFSRQGPLQIFVRSAGDDWDDFGYVEAVT